ncbi:glutathione S-transferase [Cylindrobasidium torrendii FP15055 ss-10]|uniref:glutathione transferase n=1 Tax=Cylindrobasidium torrendii FP15055 ss-10 TaxID=1314674 RepID=A0A0D7BL66_9AGAR|nr:glutathione S-transferase [Cylindrobasidium torrendii FP15055 ss-10]
MVLKLYGSRWSPNAKRVAMVLREKEVPFEAIEVDMLHSEAEYLKHQPFGEVPYIDDDGFILYESRAICRYICKKYPNRGTSLVPTALKDYALFEQAASMECWNFDVHVSVAVLESVIKPALGKPMNKTNYMHAVQRLNARLEVYDEILSRQRYLCGNEISLVDLFHIPNAVELEEAGCDVLHHRPNLSRWWKELLVRKSWKNVASRIESYRV